MNPLKTLSELESLAARKYPMPRCIYEKQKTLEKRKLFIERMIKEQENAESTYIHNKGGA